MLNYIKALSDINRLRIFSILTVGELCVCELEVILELAQSNLSKHLSTLKRSGIIESRKQSLWTMYRIKESFIAENKDLFNYIKNSIDSNEVLINDKLRLNLYYDKNISCQLASENKDEVLKLLENKENTE